VSKATRNKLFYSFYEQQILEPLIIQNHQPPLNVGTITAQYCSFFDVWLRPSEFLLIRYLSQWSIVISFPLGFCAYLALPAFSAVQCIRYLPTMQTIVLQNVQHDFSWNIGCCTVVCCHPAN